MASTVGQYLELTKTSSEARLAVPVARLSRAETATHLTLTPQESPGAGGSMCLLDDGRHVGDLVKEVEFPLVEVLGWA